ncbi:nucleoside 2-deoxyribosyltransferase [Streptomyces klenkii]|uniref:nucleoside 2-deoxyribosyltransferase n=1 Tax=Streptomyces TaxID=1883 RepID=UPI001F545D16|nr:MULTISPECIES: nucleoside 2-deoxyribosyltransferase [Streptomyces]
MIAVVGHRDLAAGTSLAAELRHLLERCTTGASVLVRAGAGLPVVVGRAVREAGRKLVVLLPAPAPGAAALPPYDRTAAGELLVLAEHVLLLPYDPADRDASVSADEQLIRSCRQVVALWDGSPSDGRDATAHLVAYARARGIPVTVFWPAGAVREPGAAPSGTNGPRSRACPAPPAPARLG